MNTANFGLIKPIKTRTVLKNFKNDEGQTFETLAKEYGMENNISRFIELLHKAVGNENFSDMEKINARRLKKGKSPVILNDMKEENPMKARIIEDLKEKAKTTTTSEEIATETANKEETTMERTPEKIKEELTNLESIIKYTASMRDTMQVLLDSAIKAVDDQRIIVKELEEKFNAEQNKLIDLESEVNDDNVQLSAHEKELADLYDQKEELEQELKSMTVVYLLAPKIQGKIKEGRNYVSTVDTVQNINVKCEAIMDTDWVSKPSLEEMVAVGYDSYTEYMEAFAFVQLVMSYKLNNKPFELVCNNKKVLALIDYEWEGLNAKS